MRKVASIAKTPFPGPDCVTKVVPAPTDGWDAISPLAVMDPKRAPILDNFVPRPGWVELRAGSQPWSLLGGTSPVETIMVRRAFAQQMFAAMGNGIYEITNLGQADKVVSGLTSARWQYINFTPALGTTVIQCVNGVDALQQYDGSSWTTPNITGLPNSLSSNNIVNISAQKRRIWFVLTKADGSGSTVAAFMPVDAITGAIGGSMDLGSLFTIGGYLVAVTGWTIDGGSGPQDYVVFLSSMGQVALYAGTDPTSPTDWSLVGTFTLAPPIGTPPWRCTLKVGSDVAIITQQGVIPLSQALPFDPSADRSVAITSRIQNAMAQASIQAKGHFGWQLIGYPDQQLAILNVPYQENSVQYQYVMNVLTGAWCRFIGWNANCFEIFNSNLYFGDNSGVVYQAYMGGSDNLNPIQGNMQCAFNYFDDPGRVKRVTMVQPLLTASGTILPTLSVDADFATSTAVAPITILTGGSLWDVAQWDVDVWSGGTIIVNSFLSVQALGRALAVHMTVNIAPSNIIQNGTFDLTTFDSAVFDASLPGAAPVLQVNAFNAIMELGGFV